MRSAIVGALVIAIAGLVVARLEQAPPPAGALLAAAGALVALAPLGLAVGGATSDGRALWRTSPRPPGEIAAGWALASLVVMAGAIACVTALALGARALPPGDVGRVIAICLGGWACALAAGALVPWRRVGSRRAGGLARRVRTSRRRRVVRRRPGGAGRHRRRVRRRRSWRLRSSPCSSRRRSVPCGVTSRGASDGVARRRDPASPAACASTETPLSTTCAASATQSTRPVRSSWGSRDGRSPTQPRRSAERWGLAPDHARADVLGFAWVLNRALLANVERGTRWPAAVALWLALAIRLLPAGVMPPPRVTRYPLDTSSTVLAAVTTTPASARRAFTLAVLTALALLQLGVVAGQAQAAARPVACTRRDDRPRSRRARVRSRGGAPWHSGGADHEGPAHVRPARAREPATRLARRHRRAGGTCARRHRWRLRGDRCRLARRSRCSPVLSARTL